MADLTLVLNLRLSEAYRNVTQYIVPFVCPCCPFCLWIWNGWGSSEISGFTGQLVFLLPGTTAAEPPNPSPSLVILCFKMKLLVFFVCYFLIWISCSTSSCCKLSPMHFFWSLLLPFQTLFLYPGIPVRRKCIVVNFCFMSFLVKPTNAFLFLRAECLER